jgi:hypothetical protein
MLTNQPAELIADYKSANGPTLLQVRGSLLASSLQTLRERGLYERYVPHLVNAQRDDILYCVAASWLPVELAMAHYAACDAMQLTDQELEAVGGDVSRRIMGTFVATLVRSARHVTTPTSIPLRQYPRLWERLLMGGGCRVYLTGPKDARIESYGVPMFKYKYFRTAYVGTLRGAGLMFRSAMHARVKRATDDALTVEINWV